MAINIFKSITEELAAALWYAMDSRFLTGIEWDYLTDQERKDYITVADSIWGSNEHFIPDEIFGEPDFDFVRDMVQNFDGADSGEPLADIASDVAKFVCGISTQRDEGTVRFETPSDKINKEIVDDIKSWLRAYDELFYDSPHNTEFARPGHIKNVVPASSSTDDGLVKLSVNLNKETAEALKSVSASMGVNITDSIHRAIAVLQFFHNEKSQGRVIQTMESDGKNKREITLGK